VENSSSWHSLDEALLDVVKGIGEAIKSLQNIPSMYYGRFIGYASQEVRKGRPVSEVLTEFDPSLATLFKSIINAANSRISEVIRMGKPPRIALNDLRVQVEVFWYLRNQKQSASDHLWISSMLRYLTSVYPKGYTALPILVYNKGREPESTLKINKSIFCPINFATYGQSFWQHWLTTSLHGTICAKL
jgi:hypothetical protein